jgi:hypothetical protein
MKIITISLLLLSLSSAFAQFAPADHKLAVKGSKYTEDDRLKGNFILDIVKDPDPSGTDSAIFVATGTGLSVGYNTLDPLDELKWRNSIPGYGGSSAIAIDRFNNIWMTTATDTLAEDVDAILPYGTGVHMSPDSGKTWVHFPQPGITPIQGLTYDLACDSLGGIWMACFGQSIQKSDDQGASWRTLTCDQKAWDPFNNMNQRMFSVHVTGSDNIWVGTAEGINLCTDYAVDDSLRVWKQFNYSNGLSGNFVTAIGSKYDENEVKEYVFAASWVAESSAEKNGVSFTSNNGISWNKCLLEEKVYNFGFNGNDVYACAESGLWKSSDNGNYWEKYSINAWSELKRGYVKLEKVYSFSYQNGKMFVGSGAGLAVSEDEGNTWFIIEAYERSASTANETYPYPNPFSPVKFGNVKLQFKINEASEVSCSVYNFAMEKVKTVVSSKKFEAGEHYLLWNGKDEYGKTAANGVYFYIISAGGEDLWNKIIIFE